LINDLQGPFVILDPSSDGLNHLVDILQSLGRKTVVIDSLASLDKSCLDPLNQPVVLSVASAPILNPEDIQMLTQLCDHHMVIVVFDRDNNGREADYFRLGVADIVEPDFQQSDIERMIDRLKALAYKRQRIQEHQQQLEKTNNELQKTLRHLQQDQRAGREVQKSLMPEGPLQFDDFEVSHAAKPSLYLSGDFVSYNLALDRYILFYFADVSGHGASSAFVTVLLRFMIGRVIRRHILEEDYAALAQAPEGLVESINQQILDTGLDKHLTIVAGSLDTKTRQLRYVVGAQQPSPILVQDGKAKFLPGKGKPAGIFDDVRWQVEQVQLPEKFALVLLSDGVYDLLPEKHIEAKEATLLDYLSHSNQNMEALKQALKLDHIKEPQDDISVLLLTGGM